MAWQWERALAKGGTDAVVGGMTAGPVGAVIGGVGGFISGGLPGSPEFEELGLMSPQVFEDYLKGSETKIRMDTTRDITRALSVRGGVRSGQLASAIAGMDATLGAERMKIMADYEKDIGEVKSLLATEKSEETREFWGGLFGDIFKMMGSGSYMMSMTGAVDKAVAEATKEAEAQMGGTGGLLDVAKSYIPTETLGWKKEVMTEGEEPTTEIEKYQYPIS